MNKRQKKKKLKQQTDSTSLQLNNENMEFEDKIKDCVDVDENTMKEEQSLSAVLEPLALEPLVIVPDKPQKNIGEM